MTRLLVLLLSIFLSTTTWAQPTKAEIEESLTNSSSRSWAFNQVVKTLGKTCTGNGQLYTFLSDSTGHRKTCVMGKPELVEFTWKLVPEGNEEDGEWNLVFTPPLKIGADEIKSVRIDLLNPKSVTTKKEMVWRFVPGSKTGLGQFIKLTSTN